MDVDGAVLVRGAGRCLVQAVCPDLQAEPRFDIGAVPFDASVGPCLQLPRMREAGAHLVLNSPGEERDEFVRVTSL